MNDQQQKVMELVVFKLKQGEDVSMFKEAAAEMNRVLQDDITGFLDRSLLHTPEEDQWVDVVYWSSMDNALGAIEILKTKKEFQSFAAMIDMQQTSMYHLIPVAI
jgi:predicted RNA-binding protein